jgi:leader peptidase (prepilin peptidase)/N-methyltransferase
MWIILSLIIGLCVGSFINMLIYRLPRSEEIRLLSPQRSICPHCKTSLKAIHLIPLLSFLYLKGKCHACKTQIHWQYPLIEVLSAVLFLIAYMKFSCSLQTLAMMEFSALMLPLIWIDFELLILPDVLTYLLLWSGLLWSSIELFTSLKSALWGAIFGYGCLFLLYHGFKWIRGREGLGLGDLKLTAALGAWFGLEAIPWMLFEAGILGLAIAFLWKKILKKKDPEIPFGPALLGAGFFQFFVHFT